MHSCIYEGHVSHRRNEPVIHQFQNRLFMVYLDLEELPALVGDRAVIKNRNFSVRSFLRSDHLFDSSRSLTDEIRVIVRQHTQCSPRGPIRLLTQLRFFGYYFSPLNLFYLYDEQDEHIEFVVAEVSNTPWNERYCYTLWAGNRTGDRDALQFSHPKDFHVSPFMDMEMEYRWKLSQPGATVKIQLANFQHDRELFSAGLQLQRRELSRQQLRRMSLRYPFMTAQIGVAIYFQALRLWWKKCPFFTHPMKSNSSPSEMQNPTQTLQTRTSESPRRETIDNVQ